MRRFFTISASFLLLITASQAIALEVGVARVDITPDYPIRLHGYLSRSGPSVGVAQPIWAKALAIGSGKDEPVVLVSVDSLGVPFEVTDEVAARLKEKAKLPRSHFVIASSHTHSAPCLKGIAPNIFGKKIADDEQAVIDRYTRELIDHLEKVSLDAISDLKPAQLSWAQGTAAFANNRRTKGGPVDHALPVLKATDPSGKLRAILVNYACHCTTLDPVDNKISGDWAGHAQHEIERDHPDVIALTVVGCGADSNPINRTSGPDAAAAAALANGRAIADEINRLLKAEGDDKSPWRVLSAPPDQLPRTEIQLELGPIPTRAQLEELAKSDKPPGYNARYQLAKLDRGEPLQSKINYPIQVWAFGKDLAMIFLPGEVVVDYVLRIKQEFDPSRVWVTAYANDVPCYIPSERILKEGGYEAGGAMVYYARPAPFTTGVENAIQSAIQKLVPAPFKAKPKADNQVNPAAEPTSPLNPREALRSIRVRPGLRVELVASEPLVIDPVAIDFGADGKLWVCEMRDYPSGSDGNWKPGGVIKVLEDRDGDGQYDTGTNFLEGLPFPTGVMAWRKGALISAAPEIIYAEDTNGDGKADIRKVLFRGFATENYQARVNGLSYNLDNWVYGANGLIGGTIHGTATGKEINIGGRDFRINPDTGLMQAASGLTQQGRTHDDWGNQFGNTNSDWIRHYPFPDHYASRNPRVAAPGPVVHLAKGPDANRIFPSSVTVERFNSPQSANRVTSGCGPMIYRDNLVGDQYKGNAFSCEPVHNIVHREVLTPDGITFAGHRASEEQDSEFLSSTDHWFRPVQARTGPDGAIWVVDMYRSVIEHPRWISPQQLATLDVRGGDDKGRIYRVFDESKPPRKVPVLARLTPRELAQQIDHPNGTHRDNVQRLLVERGDQVAAPELIRVATASPIAEARAQALCALDGLQALKEAELVRALKDESAGVRRQAIRLAEGSLGKSDAITSGVSELVNDPDLGVRFQLALSLGEWNSPKAGQLLGRIALRDGGDLWVRGAVLSSAMKQPGPILAAVVSEKADPKIRALMIGPLVSTATSAQSATKLTDLIESLPKPDAKTPLPSWWLGLASELAASQRASGRPLPDAPALRLVIDRAREIALDSKADARDRIASIRLLGREPAHRADDLDKLTELLSPAHQPAIQTEAIKGLASLGDTEAARRLIEAWPPMAPSLRTVAADALLARPATTVVLLDALESKSIEPAELEASLRQRLLDQGDPKLKARAESLLSTVRPRDRGQVLAKYASAPKGGADPAHGKAVFAKICASCHKFDGQGHEVGPDLAALTDLTFEALSTAILDPNKEVDARYASYTAALTDGRVVTGLIAAETGNALTLKRQEAAIDVILRADIEALKTTGQSLMPEGLENDLTPKDLADVISYVESNGRRPKSVEGNQPETVAQGTDGVVRLTAKSAQIYGPSLTYETQFDNLGLWNSEKDEAVWTLSVDRPSTFTVSMEWACANESAGNTYELRANGKAIRGIVDGTGASTWSRYRSIFVGELPLPTGTHRLEFRPVGPVRNALLDLRAITLTPRPQ